MPDHHPKAYSYLPIKVGPYDLVTITLGDAGPTRYRLSQSFDTYMILKTLEDDPRFEKFMDHDFYLLVDAGHADVDEDHFADRKEPPKVLLYADASKKSQLKARFYQKLVEHYEGVCRVEGHINRTVDELGPRMYEFTLAALNLTAAMMNNQRIQLRKPVSVGHFNKMYRKYMDGRRQISHIVSRDQGPKITHYVDEESHAIWAEFAETYATPTKPTHQDVWEDCCAHIDELNQFRSPGQNKLVPPKLKRIKNMIRAMSAYHVYAGRHSIAEADRKFGLTSGGFGFFRPGERVDIDEKVMDLVVLLKYGHIYETLSDEEKELIQGVKIWVIAAIDLATRYILAMRFCAAPNAQATTDILQMIMSDKREMSQYTGALSEWIGRCRPETVYTDNGSGLVNEQNEELFVLSQIGHTRPMADQPKARGHIESHFRMHRRIVRHFRGRTFKDVLEKGRYNPAKEASMPIDEIEKAYVGAILDIYHNTEQEGLGGKSPHNAWVDETRKYKMRPLIGPHVMRHIFGMEFTRVLDENGLRFMGIPYSSNKLGAWFLDRGKIEVRMRIGLEDMTHISYEMDGKWYVAKNKIDLAPGISYAEWMYIWDEMAREHGKSTALTLSHFYHGLRTIRGNGKSLALRNPLGMRQITREETEKAERRLLHASRLDFEKPVAAPVLSPPARGKAAFIDEDAPGFDNIVADGEVRAAAEKAQKKTLKLNATAIKRTPSQLGDEDDIIL